MFENPRRGRQARNFGKNVPKILDLKSSSEQIFSESIRWVPLSVGHDNQQSLQRGAAGDLQQFGAEDDSPPAKRGK